MIMYNSIGVEVGWIASGYLALGNGKALRTRRYTAYNMK
jgi:hypothetical protein